MAKLDLGIDRDRLLQQLDWSRWFAIDEARRRVQPRGPIGAKEHGRRRAANRVARLSRRANRK